MNFASRTIFTGDNLHVLRGMNSESVDLIYLDPPFNSKKQWAAPIGSQAAGAAFKDTWTLSDVDLRWHDELRSVNRGLHDVVLAAQAAGGDGTMSYLLMMSVRLLEMRRVLKPTGSIYLHCDPTESHGLKLMMDCIFGRERFLNEIAWCYSSTSQAKRWFPRKHDVLLLYAGGEEWTFNADAVRVPYKKERMPNRTGERASDASRKWKGADEATRAGLMRRGKLVEDWWPLTFGPTAPERVGYPTQKPVALLERIIAASSNEDDVVLDPFCGCATAAIAAEKLGRRWVGIDISEQAIRLVKNRLHDELGLASSLAVHRTDLPARTDLGKLPKPASHKKALYGEQAGDCNGCGQHFPVGNFHIDHIVSRKHGGTDHISNLQLLCGHCNARKGAGSMSELMAKLLAERSG